MLVDEFDALSGPKQKGRISLSLIRIDMPFCLVIFVPEARRVSLRGWSEGFNNRDILAETNRGRNRAEGTDWGRGGTRDEGR